MKKRIFTAGLFIMLCTLCGCLEATPLTDGEMDVVAEYAASLLLKYDKNYDTPLYYADEREVRLTPTPTPTPKAVATATSTPTPVPTQAEEANPTEPAKPTGVPEATAMPTPTPILYNNEETGRQLTEIIGVENITVTCEGYQIMKSVQSTEYFSLVAKEGRLYVVVNFLLHNNSDKDVVFDASEKGLEYSLDINIQTLSRVSLSMLENDLQYMEIPVPAHGTAEAVLVFEIADETINTIHLTVEDQEENTVFVKLK